MLVADIDVVNDLIAIGCLGWFVHFDEMFVVNDKIGRFV